MNSFQVWLEKAVKENAQELLFNPSQPVRMRKGAQIEVIENEPTPASATRQFLTGILTDEEKKTLFEKLSVHGVRLIGKVPVKFQLQVDLDGVSGALEIQNIQSSPWNLPPICAEILARSEGLHLLVGPRRSGKSTVLNEALRAIQGRRKVIAIYTENESQDFELNEQVVSVFPLKHLQTHGVLRSADLVVIDSDQPSFCEQALHLAETGRSVLLTLPYLHLKMGVERLLDLLGGAREVQERRLAAVFQMGLGVRLLAGIENPMQGAFELLLGTQEVKAALESGNWTAIQDICKTTGDKTGMRTLNQSLFQLLLKRKVDLKAAFEASPEPQELDSLLRKVGI